MRDTGGGAAAAVDSPRVAGYGFVPSTPSLVPGIDATPLLTWVRGHARTPQAGQAGQEEGCC
jgi:hypothetical protein